MSPVRYESEVYDPSPLGMPLRFEFSKQDQNLHYWRFKTIVAMVKALETVDGVGLARAAAQEVHLPRDFSEGKVAGAIQSRLDDNNYGLNNFAAGTQITQIGKHDEPSDLNDEKCLEIFMRDMQAWGQKMASDKEYKGLGQTESMDSMNVCRVSCMVVSAERGLCAEGI